MLKMPLPCVQVSRKGPSGLSVRIIREKRLESICELDSIEVMVNFSRIVGNISGWRNENIEDKACRCVRGFVEKEKW